MRQFIFKLTRVKNSGFGNFAGQLANAEKRLPSPPEFLKTRKFFTDDIEDEGVEVADSVGSTTAGDRRGG